MKKIAFLLILTTFTHYIHAQSFKVIGYLPDYRWSNLNNIDFSKTTHVLAAFGNPDSSGTLSFAQDIDLFASKVHAGGAKAMLSLAGGGDYSWGYAYHTYEYLLETANRTPFVHKIMNYTRLHQLDGIDLDLEGSALQLTNYNVFAQELADSLHLAGLIIGASYSSAGAWPTYVSGTTVSKLDFMTAQSYGGVGDWNWNAPSDQAPFTLFQSDITFWKSRGFNKGQLMGGLPFYAVEFPPAAQSAYWPYEPTTCSIYNGSQFASQHPLQNDLVYAANGDPVYNNSMKTYQKKVNYAVANAGGIMIWELGGDCYDGSMNILDSLNSYIANAILSVKDKQPPVESLKFYPNPANTFIKMDGLMSANKSYSIKDIFGREIQNASLSDSFIDVSKLDPGMYYISITEENNSFVPVPLMIQR